MMGTYTEAEGGIKMRTTASPLSLEEPRALRAALEGWGAIPIYGSRPYAA